jgi:acetyl-CoA synthetase
VTVRATSLGYEQLRDGFSWQMPAQFNIGVACADAQPPSADALVAVAPDGSRRAYTFGELAELSSRLANGLRGLGVERGDRVGIVLPQRVETGIAHLAVYKLGAVAVPLSILFGPDGLSHRLGDSAARAVITDAACAERVAGVAHDLGGFTIVVVEEPVREPHRAFWDLVADGSADLDAAPTTADDPAVLIYTSGTTGSPKGALHAHRVLLGHRPGFQLSHDFFPMDGDLFWTPADWAWIGGLINSLLSTWLHGKAIVAAARGAFDPEWSASLIAEQRIRNVFLPPTALKLMRQAGTGLRRGALRTVMSGGEVLGREMLEWAREHLHVTVNEIYGQTEANYVVGNSSTAWPVRPGSMGRPYPGHDVEVLGPDGAPAARGDVGEVGVRTPDPVVFLGYWGQPEATRAKVRGNWLRTGDLASIDGDGYLWFKGRIDDVISSAGYRIGPEEIEQCLLRHPAVALSAVIGVPDPLRGEAIKAFVRLADGVSRSEELERELQQFVRARLAAYEYPRAIEFVEEIPLTVTGKVRRSELRRIERDRSSRETEGGGGGLAKPAGGSDSTKSERRVR